jgi:hypothetical protein
MEILLESTLPLGLRIKSHELRSGINEDTTRKGALEAENRKKDSR